MSRRRDPDGPSPFDVRIVCGCGNTLGNMKRTDDGWVNVDPRSQPDPPRMTLGDFDKWYGNCRKCRAKPQVGRPRLEAALEAVSAAGLRSMPFRGL